MKSIMYHYIQSYETKLKNFEFLHYKNFEKQLNFFERKYDFFDCHELFEKYNFLRKKYFLLLMMAYHVISIMYLKF